MRSARVLAVAAMLGVGSAQAQQPLIRDAVIVPTTGTALISGVVVNDEKQPQPVRRAVVTLTGEGLRPSRGAVSDDNGRFTISNLPAGRFTLVVSRASFITSTYGAKRPGRPGTAIVVPDGARMTGITVKIWRGAVVAGIVRDETGVPLEGIPVTAISARTVTQEALLTLSNNGSPTNERGEFRIFGLEPGAYVLSARPPTRSSTSIVAPTEAEIDAVFAALQRKPTASGLAAISNAQTTAAPRPVAYTPVYYPGTAEISQAAPVTLSAGQEVAGLDFALRRVATSVVSGVVTRADGTPVPRATVQLVADAQRGRFGNGQPATVNALGGSDGSFRISPVAPGAYRLIAGAPATPPLTPSAGVGPIGPQHWATMPVVVSGDDLNGLALVVRPGLTITGRVVFVSRTLQAPADLTRLRVALWPSSVANLKPGTPIDTIGVGLPTSVRSDGTFEFSSVAPGTFRLAVFGQPQENWPWMLRSATMGSRDLLDGDFEIDRSGQADVTITFTDRRTQLSGTLQTASGLAASDVFVIAYAADRRYWGAGSRRVQAVRPGVDGRFMIGDLPPGEYLLAAVTDIDQDEWYSAAFLEQLVSASVKISLNEGEQKVQDLRIGGRSPRPSR